MSIYSKQKWLFGNGSEPSDRTGIWLVKSETGSKPFELDFFHESLERFVNDEDLIAFVVYFRKIYKNSSEEILRILRKNNIKGIMKNPHLLMNEDDKELFLSCKQKYKKAQEWLPLVETIALDRGLDEELNDTYF